ncbi:MAG: hypothetical protein K8T20_07685 [Planctomycetes bacterium]|nr:hypothetical protein [Planctomycetota bacterium]
MSKITLVSLLTSLVSLALVTVAFVQTRAAVDRFEQFEQAGAKPATPGGPAAVDTSALQREIEALKKELADLKGDLLTVQAGAPVTRVDPEMVSQALDDVLKERERQLTIGHAKELEAELNKDSVPWVTSLTKKLTLTETQATGIQEILKRQVSEGVKIRMSPEGDQDLKLHDLANSTQKAILELLTDSQKDSFKHTNQNWHKGRLGSAGD